MRFPLRYKFILFSSSLKNALLREQEIETKLACMQEVLVVTHNLANDSMIVSVSIPLYTIVHYSIPQYISVYYLLFRV